MPSSLPAFGDALGNVVGGVVKGATPVTDEICAPPNGTVTLISSIRTESPVTIAAAQ